VMDDAYLPTARIGGQQGVDDRHRAVGTTVVHKDILNILVCLVQCRQQCPGDVPFGIVNGYVYTD
jgi:hypothetical protein